MQLIQLTPENVKQYVGYDILFRTRNEHILKKVMGVSDTGKTVYIEHPDLNNTLQIITRKVYVIVDE